MRGVREPADLDTAVEYGVEAECNAAYSAFRVTIMVESQIYT